ncbi:hypothetical protein ZWY2020_020138 [Hordeum vulgare]|nr:hypothetical protein ZWY2020_020138 [Hordeum vulgare]
MTSDGGVPATEEVSVLAHMEASHVEDNGDANGYEEMGYLTPTSPSHRLRAPDVCPGAPRLQTKGPRRRKRKRPERGGAVLRRRLLPLTYTGGIIFEKLSRLYM